MPCRVAIVDYGMGNLHSVVKKLASLDCAPYVTSEPRDLGTADKVVLPGVGHFAKAMGNLAALGLRATLDELVLGRRKPLLGICLGMQLLAETSEEGRAVGLGWVRGDVVRFQSEDRVTFKIPHIGWNSVRVAKPHPVMDGIGDDAEFYFVHSFHFKVRSAADILNESVYEHSFTSAVQKDNIIGVQYHPEKSHDAGERLFRNFVRM